jgi:putative membrane protein
MEINIDRDALKKFSRIGILFAGILFFGFGIILTYVWLKVYGNKLIDMQVSELRYWLDGNSIRLKSGVYFRNEKSIPYEKVTDVVWYQGPLMRFYGIEGLRIQTAGSPAPEGLMLAVTNAKEVRDEIMSNIHNLKT